MFDSDESYRPTVASILLCVFSIGSIPGFFQWLLPLDTWDLMKRISCLSPGCRGGLDLYHVRPHLSPKRSSNVANPINHDPKHNTFYGRFVNLDPSSTLQDASGRMEKKTLECG